MSNELVTINLVVCNGEKYIRHCLDSVKSQGHQNIEANIFDNASTDRTVEIARKYALYDSRFKIYDSEINLGMWPGQEKLLKHSHGKYIVVLSVDVILDKDFLKNAAEQMEKDPTLGALQPKIYQWKLPPTPGHQPLTSDPQPLISNVIDTLGFQIFRSRRLINIAQGETDRPEFDQQREIFTVEGAVPIFRRQALEDCRVDGEIIDRDFFWYGDDLDLAWRMRIFGWKQVYSPKVIAYHDRSTTKSLAKHWYDYLGRVRTRQQIPIKKRRLDWANYRFTIIKNDYIINLLKDLPYIIIREIMILGYTLLFEPGVFLELPRFLRLLPKMLRRRKKIMRMAKVPAAEIHKWMS